MRWFTAIAQAQTRPGRCGVLLVGASLALASCAADQTERNESDIDVSVTNGPDRTSDDGANPFGGDAPEDQLMPDLVCMDLQSAQNEIQDHGVFFSGSTDATGQDRSQLIDSNWIVVDQFPAPGEPIGEFDAELFVVKFGEENSSLLLHPC